MLEPIIESFAITTMDEFFEEFLSSLLLLSCGILSLKFSHICPFQKQFIGQLCFPDYYDYSELLLLYYSYYKC
jgi:hypothetical protein